MKVGGRHQLSNSADDKPASMTGNNAQNPPSLALPKENNTPTHRSKAPEDAEDGQATAHGLGTCHEQCG